MIRIQVGADAPATAARSASPSRLDVDRLPFVGVGLDGQKRYWLVPALEDGQSPRLIGRTFAAWYLLFAEANGREAARRLMDRIEREMPSRYPALDRAFLAEVVRLPPTAR